MRGESIGGGPTEAIRVSLTWKSEMNVLNGARSEASCGRLGCKLKKKGSPLIEVSLVKVAQEKEKREEMGSLAELVHTHAKIPARTLGRRERWPASSRSPRINRFALPTQQDTEHSTLATAAADGRTTQHQESHTGAAGPYWCQPLRNRRDASCGQRQPRRRH